MPPESHHMASKSLPKFHLAQRPRPSRNSMRNRESPPPRSYNIRASRTLARRAHPRLPRSHPPHLPRHRKSLGHPEFRRPHSLHRRLPRRHRPRVRTHPRHQKCQRHFNNRRQLPQSLRVRLSPPSPSPLSVRRSLPSIPTRSPSSPSLPEIAAPVDSG